MNKCNDKNKKNQSGASCDNLRPSKTKRTKDRNKQKDKNSRWVDIFTRGGISGLADDIDEDYIDEKPRHPKTPNTDSWIDRDPNNDANEY